MNTGKVVKAYALVPLDIEQSGELWSVAPVDGSVGLYIIRDTGEDEAIFLEDGKGLTWHEVQFAQGIIERLDNGTNKEE